MVVATGGPAYAPRAKGPAGGFDLPRRLYPSPVCIHFYPLTWAFWQPQRGSNPCLHLERVNWRV